MADLTSNVLQAQIAQNRLSDAGTFPRVVLIDTVSFCNLRCSMCVHENMTRKRGVMPWDLFTRIIDEVAKTDPSARVWMVFFGEALIIKNRKPSIYDMIRYAKDRGLTDVVMNSNANLLDDEAAGRLIDAGLDAIYIGLDAATPETYAKLRVGGNFERTVGNVINLIELKKRRGVDKPAVNVQFVEMESNRHEKDDFIVFWKDKGATVKIRPMVSWAGSIEAPNLVMGNEERWPCHWAMQTMSITDTGKVVTCAVDLDGRFIAGDITTQSLREVWNGELARLRRLHNESRFSELPPNCRDCRDWQSARSDSY